MCCVLLSDGARLAHARVMCTRLGAAACPRSSVIFIFIPSLRCALPASASASASSDLYLSFSFVPCACVSSWSGDAAPRRHRLALFHPKQIHSAPPPPSPSLYIAVPGTGCPLPSLSLSLSSSPSLADPCEPLTSLPLATCAVGCWSTARMCPAGSRVVALGARAECRGLPQSRSSIITTVL